MVGSAGYAILAVSAVAGLAVFGFILLTYAAHCFLTIVIDSGCGVDEVQWPKEGIFDWLLKPVYCLWLLCVPTIVFGLILVPFFVNDGVLYTVTLVSVLHLVYPVVLLSSLSAMSWVALLHRPFLQRWIRRPFAYLFVVIAGVPPAALAAYVVGVTATISIWFALLGAFILPPLLLFYARLVGRYAWLICHTRVKKKRRKAKAKPTGAAVEDPWAAPPPPTPREKLQQVAAEVQELRTKVLPAEALERLDDEPPENEWTREKKPYGVMNEAQAQASYLPREVTPLDDPEGYDVGGVALRPPFSVAKYYEKYVLDDEARRERTDPPRPRRPTFATAFGRGLFLFPFYGPCVKTWVNLSLLTLCQLFFLRMLVMAAQQFL